MVAIPLASVATYKLIDLEEVASALGIDAAPSRLDELKSVYLEALRDDLAEVAKKQADEVLAAHTTAVGGMYDEEEGRRAIRLGFAHSALGEKLKEKQVFAEKLGGLYAERGIKMLVTAAAIGVDAIQFQRSPPINSKVSRLLRQAADHGWLVVLEADLDGGVKVYPPLEIDLLDEEAGSARYDRGGGADPLFEHGVSLVLDVALKSGENGFFSVSNTDALYRVMRVTTNSELGLLLARTAMFGDDEGSPWFPDNLCYYTETDYSRQVFDLLHHPRLMASQLSGLEPKALQDLGSAKHQAELHTLGLLILLHRLRTLDLDRIPRGVDLASFDPHSRFEELSRPLLLERLRGWTLSGLHRDLLTLVTARDHRDLEDLKHLYQPDPDRQEAVHRLLQAVLRAVWTIPSLGTPILWEENGRRRILAEPYLSPLDAVVEDPGSPGRGLRSKFEKLGGGDAQAFERFVEFHIAGSGFVDLRPVAVLVTARSASESLEGGVEVFHEEEAFRTSVEALEPYSYYATGGLLALLVWLQSLAREAERFDLRLGSANEFRASYPRDSEGRPLLVPGMIEARRMVAQRLEKNTGLERLDGAWGLPP